MMVPGGLVVSNSTSGGAHPTSVSSSHPAGLSSPASALGSLGTPGRFIPYLPETPAMLVPNPSLGAPTRGVGTELVTPTATPFRLPSVGSNGQPSALPIAGWNGINSYNSRCQCTPPDGAIAVGDGYVMQMVNSEMYVWKTSGGAPVYQDALTSFFNVPSGDSASDPYVYFDPTVDRWFATELQYGPTYAGNVSLAVSQGPSPFGPWYLYIVGPSPTFCGGAACLPDQPFFAVDKNNVVIAVDEYPTGAGAVCGVVSGYCGAQIFELNKTSALTGTEVMANQSYPGFYRVVPVREQGQLTNTMYLLTNCDDVGGAASCFNSTWAATGVDLLTLTGSPPGNVTITNNRLPIIPETPVPNGYGAPQDQNPIAADGLPTPDYVAENDGSFLSAVWQNGSLWTSGPDGCSLQNGTTLSCLRLVQINTTTQSVTQDFDWNQGMVAGQAQDNYDFFPAVMVDSHNDLEVAYANSSNETFPSLMLVGQVAGSPPGSMGTPILLQAGEGPDAPYWMVQSGGMCGAANGNTPCRWGDYFMGAQDPTDPCHLWFEGAFGASNDNWQANWWDTWVSEVASCGPYLPTTTLTASRSALDLGQAAQLTAKVGGGSGIYQYAWEGLPGGCTAANTAQITCYPAVAGTFPVTVWGNDTNGASSNASVTLVVSPDPTITAPTASNTKLEVGQTTTLSFTATNGTGSTSTYSWSGLPTGCASQDQTSLSCSPTAAGTFSVIASISDSNGMVVTSGALTLTVSPASSAPILSSSVTSLDVGQSVTLSVMVSGGSAPYTYAWNGLPQGCVSGNAATLACTPAASGSANVTVTVNDSNGVSLASSALHLTVSKRLIPGSFTVDPAVIDLGQSTKLTVSVSGGSGGLSYAWSGLPSGCSTNNSVSLTCAPSVSGTSWVTVAVTDSNGESAVVGPVSFTVAPALGSASVSPSISSFPIGESVTFTAAVTGGTAPYTYTWNGLPTGCASVNSPTLTCIPTVKGAYSVSVKVTDATGASVTSSAQTVSVTKAVTPAATGLSNGLDWSILALAVVGLVVALIGLFLALRRRGPAVPQGDKEQSGTGTPSTAPGSPATEGANPSAPTGGTPPAQS